MLASVRTAWPATVLLLAACMRSGFGQELRPLDETPNELPDEAVVSLHPNEPAGFTPILTQPCETALAGTADAASGWWGESAGIELVEDGTARLGRGFWRTTLPDGACCDQLYREAWRDFRDGGGTTYTSLYVSMWIRQSSNWVPHPVSSSLFMLMVDQVDDQGATVGYDGWTGTMVMRFAQADNRGYLYASEPAQEIAQPEEYDAGSWLGEWAHYELLAQMNTGNNADGTARLWVNGVLVMDTSEAVFATATLGPAHEFVGLVLLHYYGGDGGSSDLQHEDIDDIYISGN